MCVSVNVCLCSCMCLCIRTGHGSRERCGHGSGYRSSWGCGHGFVAKKVPSNNGRRAPARMETRVKINFVQERFSAARESHLRVLSDVFLRWLLRHLSSVSCSPATTVHGANRRRPIPFEYGTRCSFVIYSASTEHG